MDFIIEQHGDVCIVQLALHLEVGRKIITLVPGQNLYNVLQSSHEEGTGPISQVYWQCLYGVLFILIDLVWRM